ncbi:unnamed protein product [Brachionus calyciflorus]|uniref:Uncharacterized protein n=1 Tax=Brachionus calyciflorus TaxID=104777 RepID=A0A814DMH0_9BILA|nr:unnamed protein product [Brachionus calyciflorus]
MSDSVEEWSKKLVGKKFLENGKQGDNTFSHAELEGLESFRILRPKTMMTMDYREERLNVNLDSNDVCKSVHFG